MAASSSKKASVPEAKEAMSRFKAVSYTHLCSTSSVMFQQSVSVLQQAWELSFLQAVQRARDMLFQMQRL